MVLFFFFWIKLERMLARKVHVYMVVVFFFFLADGPGGVQVLPDYGFPASGR